MVLSGIKTEIEILGRHMRLLRLLKEKGPLGIVKLSHLTNLPPHQIRYSLRVLQQSGLLQPTTRGALINEEAKKLISGLESEKKLLIRKLKTL